jgi:hypothetical protein
MGRFLATLILALTMLPATRDARADLYLDLTGSAGVSAPLVDANSPRPFLGIYSGGATLGYRLFGHHLLLGAESHYRVIAQYSDVNTMAGNMKGSRWDLASPVVGIGIGSLLIKIDAQLLGDLALSTPAADGSSIAYSGPQGVRVELLYRTEHHFLLGFFYEGVSFRTQKDVTHGMSTDLGDSKLTIWTSGVSFGKQF